jgi:hypothetical protein
MSKAAGDVRDVLDLIGTLLSEGKPQQALEVVLPNLRSGTLVLASKSLSTFVSS